jgi:putative ABC transport system permease protein
VGLFTKDVLVWLGGAFVVAVPVAYLGASAWLDQFAYRVAVGAGTFGWAGVVVGGLALLTAGAQAYRAARTDPAAALRDA